MCSFYQKVRKDFLEGGTIVLSTHWFNVFLKILITIYLTFRKHFLSVHQGRRILYYDHPSIISITQFWHIIEILCQRRHHLWRFINPPPPPLLAPPINLGVLMDWGTEWEECVNINKRKLCERNLPISA